jgi:hypothetical protein
MKISQRKIVISASLLLLCITGTFAVVWLCFPATGEFDRTCLGMSHGEVSDVYDQSPLPVFSTDAEGGSTWFWSGSDGLATFHFDSKGSVVEREVDRYPWIGAWTEWIRFKLGQ